MFVGYGADSEAVGIFFFLNLSDFEELYTGYGSFGIFAPLINDRILFDVAPLYIFKMMFFYDLPGKFVL